MWAAFEWYGIGSKATQRPAVQPPAVGKELIDRGENDKKGAAKTSQCDCPGWSQVVGQSINQFFVISALSKRVLRNDNIQVIRL